jgi:hypothetical protein
MRQRVEAANRAAHAGRARGLTFVRVVGIVALIAGVVVSAAATSSATPRWSVVPTVSPRGAPNGQLSAVSCSSPSDCFAVGTDGSGSFIERWNGTSWSIVASPSPSQIFVELLGVSCTSPTSCVAVGDAEVGTPTTLTSKTLIERWNGTKWSIVASPTPDGASTVILDGVSCSNATDCLAVGYSSNSSINATVFTASPIAEHWDGTSWSLQSVPSPNDSIETELVGVSCPTATTCFAAGGYEAAASGGAILEQWNGTDWSIVASADSANAVTSRARVRVRHTTDFARVRRVVSDASPYAGVPVGIGIFGFATTPGLDSVSCVSVTSCVAVGASFAGALVERWDGTSWTVVDSPTPAGSVGASLDGVSCASATDCSAVGASQVATVLGNITEVGPAPLAEHWNGISWSVEAEPTGAPFSSLAGISCPSSTSCAAVGDSASVQQWDGKKWSMSPLSAKSSESEFTSVSCLSATDCFAVGNYLSSNTQGNTLVERWNGTTWTVVPSPKLTGPGDALLGGVSCSTPTNCMAIGSMISIVAASGLVERWDGTRWQILNPPSPPGAQFVQWAGVSCSSPTSCFAVGEYATQTAQQALVERWNGGQWSIVPSPIPADAQATQLNGVSCLSATDCTAVGSALALNGSRSPGVRAFVEHWDGVSWTAATGANPTGVPLAALTEVSCSSSTSCVAVGVDASSLTATNTSWAEYWNGQTWTFAATASPSGATGTELVDLACRSSNSCYAVGSASTSTATNTLVEHWNSTRWTLVAAPNPTGANAASLSGVSCPTATNCVAVGSYSAHDSFFTLAELGS